MTTGTDEPLSLRLRLICVAPPLDAGEPAVFGLQDKQRALDPGQSRPDGSIAYECVVQVRRRQDGTLRFSGPHVHGPAGDPFLYLSLRRETEPAGWIRRLKVPLDGITWRHVLAATDAEGRVLEGRVEGTGSARTPLLGDGWEVRGGAE